MHLERTGRRVDPLALASQPGLADPAVVTVRGWRVVAADPLGVVRDLPGLARLARVVGWRDGRRDPALAPFGGGAIGYVSDDASAGLLALPSADPRPPVAPLPAVRFAVHDSAVCVAPDGEAWVAAQDVPGWTREPAAVRAAAWRARLDAAAVRAPDEPAQPGPPRFSLAADDHRRAVRTVHEWIAAGDLYQLNVTLQVAVPWAGGGGAFARRLWGASPHAAHAAWLRLPGADVVSVSPETFLTTDGSRVAMRPIKGTRPRGLDPAEDRALAGALRASAKDRAEHVMIVDLVRNDLGRVCATGSVRVDELAALERHPTVWHLTSTVGGRLREDVGLDELVGATFPCGSVTGAPKRMAWDRARRLEPVRRGVYCGAIGVVARGLVDLSVAIRTAVLAGGVASYGTGGGIVADSDADAEWREAMDKAHAFLTAVRAPAQLPAAR